MSLLKEIIEVQTHEDPILILNCGNYDNILMKKTNLAHIDNFHFTIEKPTYKGRSVVDIVLDELHTFNPNLDQISIENIRSNNKNNAYINELPRNISKYKKLDIFSIVGIEVKSGVLPKEYLEHPTLAEIGFIDCGLTKVELPNKVNDEIVYMSILGDKLSNLDFIDYINGNHIDLNTYIPYLLCNGKLNFDRLFKFSGMLNVLNPSYLYDIEKLFKYENRLKKNISLGIEAINSKKALRIFAKIKDKLKEYDMY